MHTADLKDSLALLRRTIKRGTGIEAALQRDNDEGDGKKKEGKNGGKKMK